MGVPASTIGPAPYPEWAHSHWVWLASSVANQTSETQLVLDYLARDVQVGGVDIDSQWATGDNNFVWDNEKYPDPKGMISNFHSLGVNVICWVTSVVNTDSSNYQEGLENNYFLNTSRGDGHVGLVNWWHGEGAFIDYTNPAALDWWHAQMDNVIDMGVDGWKCDGTDPYTFELYPIESYAGQITERDYANLYYGDFFNYTRTKNPNALIMSRPVDSYYVVYWSFSPHDVMYSGWVGDQDPTFDGLKDALRNMFHSAWRNYTNYGSDIGGYRSGNRTKDLFIRWAQLGAFCPLMENGGDGEHRPWMFDNTNQTLNIYRTFVDIHYELRPYFLNAGSTSMEEHIPVMYPQADRTLINPRNWAYLLWTDILVNPIVEDSTTVKIEFPSGNDWIDWWDSSITYQGGSTQHLEYPLELFPVFIRKGAMLALNVTKDLKLGHGDEFSAGRLTLFVPHAVEKGSQVVRRQNMISQEFEYIFNEEEKVFQFTATAHERKLLLVLHNVASAPTSIENIITSQKLTKYNSELEFRTAESGFYYNPLATVLIVKPCVSDNGNEFILYKVAKIKNHFTFLHCVVPHLGSSMDVPVMWECLKQNNQWVSLGKDISKHIEDYFQQKVVSCEYTDASVRRTGPGLQEFNKMEKAKLITNWTDVAVQDLSKHEKCSICLCEFHDDMEDDEDDEDEQIVHLSRCGPHYYHRDCILNCYVPPQDSDRLVHDGHLKCPICAFSYGIRTGRMPFGTMEVSRYNQSLPSYEGYGIIQIIYSFPPGVQGPEHPAPGTLYTGTVRKCFLPNNDEGRAVLQKLEIAFQRRLTFVVGTSITSGRDNTVVWNGIHHKTNLYGGPARYGYPDPTYLFRVSEELANVGIL